MASLPISIQRPNRRTNITVEIDAKRFEQLAGLFGFFSKDALKSIASAERDIKAGRVKKIVSLSDLG